jgi:hypothetical protein
VDNIQETFGLAPVEAMAADALVALAESPERTGGWIADSAQPR